MDMYIDLDPLYKYLLKTNELFSESSIVKLDVTVWANLEQKILNIRISMKGAS